MLILAPDPAVAASMKLAAIMGTFDGRATATNRDYLAKCRRLHQRSGTTLIYTRDTGHHTSGWFKNPEFERCLHLSLSFFEPGQPLSRRPFDRKLAEQWATLFFEGARGWVWGEPPVTPDAKRLEVWHYRLFCDANWRPIKPRGEVYSTELTERGWKSATELFETEGRVVESPLSPG